LLDKTDIKPIIYEMSDSVGGICRTINYKGNRMDIGGHRFFSKSERILQWWQSILPLEKTSSKDEVEIQYQGKKRAVALSEDGPDPEEVDKVMLIRNRRSRIFYLRKFFNYPISLNLHTLRHLGLKHSIRILLSYLQTRLFPIKLENSLRDFMINRFGKELYLTFFRSYTQKVWGVPPRRIKAEWGAQRIKGLSLSKAVINQLKSLFFPESSIRQKSVETSLIEKFLYPKYGPGQMWEEVARKIKERGGEIHQNVKVSGMTAKDYKMTEVKTQDQISGKIKTQKTDFLFSTMPVKELIQCLDPSAPEEITTIAEGLVYRDFITAGLLLKKFKVTNGAKQRKQGHCPPDNWIYIQDGDVKVGRIQIFNNWSPYLVKDKNTVWVGMEYFCQESDELWGRANEEVLQLAVHELIHMGMIEKDDFLDGTVVRMPKAYPAYFGTYDYFDTIRNFTDRFENLFLIGRNGMHRYNNQDHSMLTAMAAVENIASGIKTKHNVWDINTEQEYQEENRKI